MVVRVLSLGQQHPYDHVVARPPAGGPCGPDGLTGPGGLSDPGGARRPLSPQALHGAGIASEAAGSLARLARDRLRGDHARN